MIEIKPNSKSDSDHPEGLSAKKGPGFRPALNPQEKNILKPKLNSMKIKSIDKFTAINDLKNLETGLYSSSSGDNSKKEAFDKGKDAILKLYSLQKINSQLVTNQTYDSLTVNQQESLSIFRLQNHTGVTITLNYNNDNGNFIVDCQGI